MKFKIKIIESSYTSIEEKDVKKYADILEKLLIKLKFPYNRIDSGSSVGKSVYFESLLWRTTPIRISAHSKGAKNYALHINIESVENFEKLLLDIRKINYQPLEKSIELDNEQYEKIFKKRVIRGLKELEKGKDFKELHKDVQRDLIKYNSNKDDYDF